MLGFAEIKNWLAKKNSFFPSIYIGKAMEEVIEKRVTGRTELGVAEYLQHGRHCVDVLYLAFHLIIKTHMIIPPSPRLTESPETVRKLRTRDIMQFSQQSHI